MIVTLSLLCSLLSSLVGSALAAPPPLPDRGAGSVDALSLDTLDGLARALSARDGLACADLGPASPALRDNLLLLASRQDSAPAVPVRAAACLVEQFPADPSVIAAAAQWLQDPATRGLGLIVVQDLSRFAPQDRAALAAVALSTPDPTWQRRYHTRLLQSPLPDIVAIAQAVPAPVVKNPTE